jgi:hypothetical protein
MDGCPAVQKPYEGLEPSQGLAIHSKRKTSLPARGYGFLELDLAAERIEPILQASEAAVQQHFQGRYPG